MTFWVLAIGMLVVAATLIAWPLLRGGEATDTQDAAVPIYRDQLRQLDHEVREGTLTEEEARFARREINRRLLTTMQQQDEQQRGPISTSASPTLAFFTALLLVAGAASLYLSLGRPDLALRGLPPATTAGESGEIPSLAEAISQLEARLEQSPEDPEGWRLLGWARLQTGNLRGAVSAYRRSVELAPDNAVVLAALAEALTMANEGVMPAETRMLLDAALRIDPHEERARFYDALWYRQQGDIASALDRWIGLINDAESDAPWLESLTVRVAELADAAGMDISDRLSVAATTRSTPPGPTREAIEGAAQMSPEARQAMIDGMVARLEDRLRENPDDPDGWLRLIKSRLVLQQPEAARSALDRAREALAGNPDAVAEIEAAALAAGLTPAP